MTVMSRFAGRVNLSAATAATLAAALVVCGVGLGLYNENRAVADLERQCETQAKILAGSLAAPLAFDDLATAREYLGALRVNPAIEAAAAYRRDGALMVGFSALGPAPPNRITLTSPQRLGEALIVTAPVTEGSTALGSVYLRTSVEPWQRRAARYIGIGLLLLMASILVAVLGSSQALLSKAHRSLQAEIAEREKAEKALRQAQKMEAMGQLTGGVAHDFNNLLMVASSGLDLMEKATNPVRREQLKQAVRQSIDRSVRLTQQLLAFARRSALKPEVVDSAVLITGMRELLERSLREDIAVEFRLEASWFVEVDVSQLEVAILNIAVNARDAMPAGGKLSFSTYDEPGETDFVRISIRDSGAGMAQETIERIFEPFFTTKPVGQGTGLGLSQVYGFVKSSGGDVQIESAIGEGTTVSLLIPRSLKTLSKMSADPPPAAANPDRARVLMVEDDDNVAGLVGEMLSELSYEPVRAISAANALDKLANEGPFDLVFSDMVMPGGMDGLQLAREIAKRMPSMPVVLTTGYSEAATSVAAEGIRLLVKPYRIDLLALELQAALGHRRA
jgi:signal transduction histidine kinase/CheY-like chemotaxis protein